MASELPAGILADLDRDEGTVLHAYQDSLGFWTIGTGILIDQRRGGGITEDENLYLLTNRVQRAAAELDTHAAWWRGVCNAWQRALLNMTYEMGIGGVLGFPKMLAALQAGDGETAATDALDSLWAREQSPLRAQRIAVLLRG